MKIYWDRRPKIPISNPVERTQDDHKCANGGYQWPERERANNTEEWVNHVHGKTGKHQRGERETDSVDSCLGSTMTVDPKDSQKKEARREGEEEESSDLPEERDRDAEDVEGYATPESKEEDQYYYVEAPDFPIVYLKDTIY